MSQRSRFFDSTGGDRTYDSAAFAQVISGIVETGIVAGLSSEYAVTENSPPAMNVLVGLGKSFILGYFHEVYSAAEVVTIGAAHATLSRIDRVVLRRDLTNRTVSIVVIAGTPGASPSAPAVTTNTAGNYDIKLAQVLVPPLSVSVINSRITDEREFGTSLGNIMDPTTGHDHDGVDSKKVTYTDLLSIPATFAPTSHTLASHTGQLDHGTALTGLTDDDHTQYQLESEKNAQNGYAGLDNDASARVPGLRMGTGFDASATKVLLGDRTFGLTPAHASRHATGGADALTPANIGGTAAYNTPATAAGGKRVYVGTATPTGASEGDIWVDG